MIDSALEMQYELMSHTVMCPLESPVINISLEGSVAKARTLLSSSVAAVNLPAKSITMQCIWAHWKQRTTTFQFTNFFPRSTVNYEPRNYWHLKCTVFFSFELTYLAPVVQNLSTVNNTINFSYIHPVESYTAVSKNGATLRMSLRTVWNVMWEIP